MATKSSSLIQRLMKVDAAKNSAVSVLKDSNFIDTKVVASTKAPMINVALSGDLEGGITPGILMLIGESKTFKTNLGLLMVKSYLDAHEDAVAIFIDTEFGASRKYFKAFDIPEDRVIHAPLEDIEKMKILITQQLNEIKIGEKVIFMIDSISQVASVKEASDAEDGNTVQDMTRARSLNSFWRIITPKLNLREIPLIVINSFYADQKNQYADPIVKGGKQGYLSSNSIWMIGRRQIKDKTSNTISGYDFIITALKSRFIKEKTKIPFTVMYNGGIDLTSGLLDIARAGGFVEMPTSGWYTRAPYLLGVSEDKKVRRAEMDMAWWEPVLNHTDFKEFIKFTYGLDNGMMLDKSNGGSIFENMDEETGECS